MSKSKRPAAKTAAPKRPAAKTASTKTGGDGAPGATEQLPSAEDQDKTPAQERRENNPTGTRADGTTPRHTEPLGPPAPGQRGVPGPERRVVPQQGVPAIGTRADGEDPVPDTPEGMAEYKASLGPVIRVKATQTGFHDNVRRRAGDVFDVREQEFSKRWMVRVDGGTAPRSTGAQRALNAAGDKAFEETNGRKRANPRSSGDRDVLS